MQSPGRFMKYFAPVSDIENYDASSADSFVMASEDLENNFANVYFNYLMSN